MKHFFIFLVGILSFSSNAQSFFTSHQSFNIDGALKSNICIGLVDLNGDKRDDAMFLDGGNRLYVAYQGVNDGDFTIEYVAGTGGEQWTISAGDLDNDGLNEILVSGFYDGLKIFKKANKSSAFELDQITTTDFFAQGSNTADINNDGWLDSFVCDDDSASEIFLNDGTGYLEQNDFINMNTTPISDNSGNYGSTWIDIDNDRDLDLYIAKCRLGVNSSEDPRRINALFINDGSNNFTEQAEDYGLKIGHQSWTADFGDVDNDGDLDCFVINHDYKYQLLIQNENGVFEDSPNYLPSDMTGNGLQGTFTDFDNDGFLDILISGSGCKMLMNNGDTTFTINEQPFGLTNANTYAIGDINDDGFSDVFLNYGVGFSGSGAIGDEIFVNNTNDNNWVKLCLNGVESNRSAVGTRIECYGDWGVQIRDVKSGQSYGIMNSLNQIIGLGEYNNIDSLLIHWPSGHMDKYLDVNPNTIYHVDEGGCMNAQLNLVIQGTNILCAGQSKNIILNVDGEVLWSNGVQGNELNVTEAGVYYAEVIGPDGCKVITNNIEFVNDPGAVGAVIEMYGENNVCNGESILLSIDNANQINWSNGETTNTIEIYESGIYYADVDISCGVVRTDSIEITIVNPNQGFEVFNDTIAPLKKATLQATGGNLFWYSTPISDEIIATGTVYETDQLTETTSYYVENISGTPDSKYVTGHSNLQIDGSYSGDEFNGETLFDVFAALTLDSVTVETDIEGIRIIQLLNADKEVITHKEVMLKVGRQSVYLGFEIEEGEDYTLMTNADSNLSTFGYLSPRLVRNSQNVNYPYQIENVISIINSNYGEAYYYYFYDWQVTVEGQECISERQEVLAVVDESLSTFDVSDFGIEIYPIPTYDQLQIQNVKENYWINVYDLTGKRILNQNISTDLELNLTQLKSGVYTLTIENGVGERALLKFVKM